MPSFLEDYSAFSGDGSNNEDNLSLDEFLESYDPLKYRSPSVTADILLLCHNGPIETVKSGMSLLMVRRRNHPCIGYWALPGGFCEIGEDLEDTARRELEEETGYKAGKMKKLLSLSPIYFCFYFHYFEIWVKKDVAMIYVTESPAYDFLVL